MTPFAAAVAHQWRGVEHPSAGACPGCAECGLEDKECGLCDATGTVIENDIEITCPECKGAKVIKPTEDEIEIAMAGEGNAFSASRCEGCGSYLGGSRHPAHGMLRGELTHLDVCVDCLMYLANGDEPEEWEGKPNVEPEPKEVNS